LIAVCGYESLSVIWLRNAAAVYPERAQWLAGASKQALCA
jgi:hypothetical protein